MPTRSFIVAPLGTPIAASLSWQGAPAYTLEKNIATSPPVFTVAPSISGTAQVGETLTGSDGTITGGSVSARQWLRDGVAISGATSSTYTLVEADEATNITYRVTAIGAGGTTQATSAAVGPVAAAPIPISAVAADGWQSTALTPTDPPTLQSIDVTRQGFDATGTAATIEDTLYLTKRVRQPDPNETSFTTDSVALSDYIYSGDTIAGVTNNSTAVSPKPIATWGRADRQLIGNTLDWEIIAFHRDARQGRQVVCVGVRATDGTNTTAWQYVSAPSLSTYCEDANAPEVFSGALDISGLNDDALITLEGKVFPWFGSAASVLDSTTETEFRFSPRYYYRNTTRAATPNVVYVASTGNDSTGVVGTDPVAAKASPCLTVGGAIQRAASVLGNATKNVLSGLEVRVVDGVSMGTVGFVFANQDAAAIKITRDPTVTRAAANITMSATLRPFSAGNNRTPDLTESAIYFEDVTITMGANVSYQGESARKMHVQFRNVNYNFASIAQTTGMRSNSHLSFFGLNVSNYNDGFNFTTAGDVRTMRGMTISANDKAIWGYNVIGCQIDNGILTQDRGERGALIYNNHLPDGIGGGSATIFVSAQTAGNNMGGVAIVQNLAPYLRTGNSPSIRISADSDNGNTVHAVVHHNTCVGADGYGRWNLFYDDTTATARTHKLVSFKGNLGPQLNTKGDIFMSNSARTGNFPFVHGVGCAGNFTEHVDSAGGIDDSFRQSYPGIDTTIAGGNPLHTDDRAVTSGPVAGSDGGDYTLQVSSPARDLFSQYLLGFDIAGNARSTSGTVDAGCYA